MDFFDEEFGSLMKEMAAAEGEALCEQETVWHDRVPTGVDRAAYAALASAAGAAAAAAAGAGAAWLKVVKGAALTLAAAAVITVGGYFALPALRGEEPSVIHTLLESLKADDARREPGEYVIPSPGDGFRVVDEAAGDRAFYRWFTSGEQEVLVEIARKLPNAAENRGTETVLLDNTIAGVYYEQDDTKYLILHDGDVIIQITFFRGDKAELLSYAEALIEAND